MNFPTINLDQLDEQPVEETQPHETASQKTQWDRDAIMRQQRGFKHRRVPIQCPADRGVPIRIHHGPRPTGKEIRAARAAARKAKSKVTLAFSNSAVTFAGITHQATEVRL